MGIDDRNLDLTHHKKYRRQTAKMMFFAFGNLIYISVLLVNAIAILSEDRFLARVGWSNSVSEPAFGTGNGGDASVKQIDKFDDECADVDEDTPNIDQHGDNRIRAVPGMSSFGKESDIGDDNDSTFEDLGGYDRRNRRTGRRSCLWRGMIELSAAHGDDASS